MPKEKILPELKAGYCWRLKKKSVYHHEIFRLKLMKYGYFGIPRTVHTSDEFLSTPAQIDLYTFSRIMEPEKYRTRVEEEVARANKTRLYK